MIRGIHACDLPLLFSYNWELVGNIIFVYISNPDLVGYNYQQTLLVYIIIGYVATTYLDCLLINNLWDVLFKFIHALILYFIIKLRYITSF